VALPLAPASVLEAQPCVSGGGFCVSAARLKRQAISPLALRYGKDDPKMAQPSDARIYAAAVLRGRRMARAMYEKLQVGNFEAGLAALSELLAQSDFVVGELLRNERKLYAAISDGLAKTPVSDEARRQLYDQISELIVARTLPGCEREDYVFAFDNLFQSGDLSEAIEVCREILRHSSELVAWFLFSTKYRLETLAREAPKDFLEQFADLVFWRMPTAGMGVASLFFPAAGEWSAPI